MAQYTLQKSIENSLNAYFADLGDSQPSDMYAMMVQAIEKPLLEVVMQKADQNQSRAAKWLGLNRNTLRKKLQDHNLLVDALDVHS